MFDKNTLEPKQAFLTNDRAADNTLLNSWGYLTYNSDSHNYIIASKEKLEDFDNIIDRYLMLNTETCLVEGEGPLTLGLNRCKEPYIAYGNVTIPSKQVINGPETKISSIFGITFPMDSKVIDALAQQISDDMRLSAANSDNDVLRHAMINYMGEEAGEENYMSYVTSGAFDKVPKAFEHTLFFEKIDWNYSAIKKSSREPPIREALVFNLY